MSQDPRPKSKVQKKIQDRFEIKIRIDSVKDILDYLIYICFIYFLIH